MSAVYSVYADRDLIEGTVLSIVSIQYRECDYAVYRDLIEGTVLSVMVSIDTV